MRIARAAEGIVVLAARRATVAGAALATVLAATLRTVLHVSCLGTTFAAGSLPHFSL